MCIATTPARLFATRRTIDGSLMPETSFTIDAPASMAFEATAGFIVSTERGTGTLGARPRITGPPRRNFITQNEKQADHASPVPPCRLPRVRGEGEGPEVRPGHPCIETSGKGGGSARLLRQCREAGRRESGERRQGRRRERRGRGGPDPYEACRPLPVCPLELVPRRTRPRPGAHRVPRKRARRPGLRGPCVALRILQVLQGRGEGSPAKRTFPRNRRRIRRRG